MQQMVSELQANGAIITANDFEQYTVANRPVTNAIYETYNILGISAPGGGPVLGLILNILDGIYIFVCIYAHAHSMQIMYM